MGKTRPRKVLPEAYSSRAGSTRPRTTSSYASSAFSGAMRRASWSLPQSAVSTARASWAGLSDSGSGTAAPPAALGLKSGGHGLAGGAEEHGVVGGAGARGQGVLEGALELPVVGVAEDVVDDGAGRGPSTRTLTWRLTSSRALPSPT